VIVFIVVPKNSGLKEYRNKALELLLDIDKNNIIEARGEDVASWVTQLSEKGKKVIGLTGEDLYKEFLLNNRQARLKVLKKITWNDKKALFGKPALCLLGPEDKNLEDLPKNLNVCGASKYKRIIKKYLNFFESKGFTCLKTYASGAVETSYVQKLSDLIIDIVYTGSSMKKNGLKVYDKIMESDFLIIGTENKIQPRQNIQLMKKYDPPLEGREGKLRLDFNENTVGCSPRVIQALQNVSAETLSTYPEYSKFREKLAKYLSLKPEQVLRTNGTDEAIQTVMMAYLNKDDEIILPVPTFAIFEVYASIIGARINKVLYNEDLSFPTQRVLNNINNKTKMVILVNPNNPTGTAIPEEDIISILEKARNCIVLIDEAYYQFYGKSAKELLPRYENLIIIQTFSKAFGLAGLRLGYLMAKKEIIANLEKVISPYSVNSIAMVAAEAALDDREFVNNYVKEVEESKKYVANELMKLGIRVFPSEANFVIANFGEICDKVYEKLKERGILVRNRTNYPLLKNCLRIGIGTKEQSRQLLAEINNILRPEEKKAILFDMDGVLVDVMDSYRLVIKKTAEFFTNTTVTMEDIQKVKNQGNASNDWDVTCKIIESKGAFVNREKIIEKFQELYLGTKGKKGLRNKEKWLLDDSVLKKLKEKYVLGVVTGRPREEAEYALELFDKKQYFDCLVALGDYSEEEAKPNPFPITLALNKLNSKSGWYIGDTVDDIKAGIVAGLDTLGVIPPDTDAEPLQTLLKQAGAKAVIEDIDKISEVLE